MKTLSLDVSKINSLGWKAKIGLEEGIKDIYNWYKVSGCPQDTLKNIDFH